MIYLMFGPCQSRNAAASSRSLLEKAAHSARRWFAAASPLGVVLASPPAKTLRVN